MAKLILFNKPFRVLSQFTDDQGRETLANFMEAPGFRSAGRLDYDSEGLLLLTDNGKLQQQIANPRFKLPKTYWVQVEGDIDAAALAALTAGVELKDGWTLPARAYKIPAPDIWARNPPVRERKSVVDSWLELTIREGRNRQVRRMTAATGFPTLRLIRVAVGRWRVGELQPGEYAKETVHLPKSGATGAERRKRRSR